ncbi:MAG: ABC transporter permease [Propionibacteriaceae bacterium]|nr:ABC transporter permease [Propionibacteriaceae bacterium]
MTLGYWLGRIVRSVLVLFVVTVLVSAMTYIIPGDPALAILGPEASPEQLAELRHALGLDTGFLERYTTWIGNAFQGDLGLSFSSGRPVAAEFGERLPVTLQVVLMAEVLALAIAVPLALYGAYRHGGWLDRLSSTGAFLLMAIPSFVIGLILIWLFAVLLGWLPASGFVPFAEDPLGNLQRMVLPVITLGLAEAAVYTRVLRGAVIESLEQPFAFAAQTRGASPSQLLWRTVLRPSSLPLLNLVGINLGVAFGGTLLVETLFALPGVGRLAISAIGNRDLPLIQGVVLFAALAVVVMNMVVDVAQRFIDSRSERVTS